MLLFSNNATTLTATDFLINDNDLEVLPGTGNFFPVVTAPDYCYVTLEDVDGNYEIVKVIARAPASDTLSVERAQENTTEQDFLTNSRVEIRCTAAAMEVFVQREDDILDGGTF